MLKDIVARNRSYRRFDQSKMISLNDLKDLIALARLSPSGRNLQTLKYFIANEPGLNSKIYPMLAWAGYLKDWDGPIEGERPTAYIVIVEDTSIGKNMAIDQGIVAQTIMLGATEKGLGGCMIHSVNRKELAELLNLDQKYEICLVLALGVPVEKVVIEPIPADGSIRYWRDAEKVHHVPKRDINDLILY